MKITLGENIRLLRKSKDLRQSDLASELGLTHKAISRYENDKAQPDLKTLEKMARFFEVDMNFLLDFSSTEPPDWQVVLRNDDVHLLEKFLGCSHDHQRLLKMMADELYKIDNPRRSHSLVHETPADYDPAPCREETPPSSEEEI